METIGKPLNPSFSKPRDWRPLVASLPDLVVSRPYLTRQLKGLFFCIRTKRFMTERRPCSTLALHSSKASNLSCRALSN